ncbi:MAG: hypothetical protein IKC79_02580 [Clostridia bacterium]|nr:hypothetical protein [Clostridia bacterium]
MLTTKKHSIALIIIVIMLSLISVGGICYAYFTRVSNHSHDGEPATTSTQIYSLTATSDSYTIGTPYTQSISADANSVNNIAIHNSGDLAVYMRVNLMVVTAQENVLTPLGNDYYDTTIYQDDLPIIHDTDTFDYHGWTLVENGYYYYNSIVSPGDFVPFASVSRTNANVQGATIKVAVEVVQATPAIANLWHPSMTWNTNDRLDHNGQLSLDGVDLSPHWSEGASDKIVPIYPNGNKWKTLTPQEREDQKLLVPLTRGTTTAQINNLVGDNNNSYLRLYNATRKYMMFNVNYNIMLQESTDGIDYHDVTALWAQGNYFGDVKLELQFVDSTNWIDVRADASNQFVNDTGAVSYVYNRLVNPGESIGALASTVTLTGLDANLLDENNQYNGKYYAFRIYISITGLESTVLDGEDTVQKALDTTDGADGFFAKQLSKEFDTTKLDTLRQNLTTQYTRWLDKIGLLDNSGGGE